MTAKNFTFDYRRDTNRAIQTASGVLLLLFCGVSFVTLHSEVWAEEDKRCESAEVRLLSRTLDGQIGIAPPVAFQSVDDNKRIHLLIRFNQPLTLDQHRALDEHGIELLEYIENCAYIASLSKANWGCFTSKEGNVGKLLGPLDPEDKISAEILDRDFYEWAIEGETGHLKVVIGFHEDVAKEAAEAALANAKMTPSIIRGEGYGPRKHGPHSWKAIVEIGGPEVDGIKEIAKIDAVRRIEQGPKKFIPANNLARKLVKSENVQDADLTGPSPEYRIGGEYIRIGICDQGVDENHVGLGASRLYHDMIAVTGADDHGTTVASIAAGNGTNSTNSFLRGHAPLTEFGDYPRCGAEEDIYKQAIVDYGTRVTNHSYELTSIGTYDWEAGEIDHIIRGSARYGPVKIPARPQVWAAGNHGTAPGYEPQGYYSVKAPGKNMIVVGSTDTVDRRLSSFSSLGPTWDGRIKPDLVAPGCKKSDRLATSVGVSTADPSTSDSYAEADCGTSYAAPVVTGVIALMMEEYRKSFSVPSGPRRLNPATHKAVLVNTAIDQVKYGTYGSRDYKNPDTGEHVIFHRGPDFAAGFGLVDALGACELIKDKNRWIQSLIAKSGERDRWCLPVLPKTGSLKVTLAWDDEKGSVGHPLVRKLVNDLDLLLVSPSGETIRPWTVLPPRFNRDGKVDANDIRPAKRQADRYNNVEMARVQSTEAGIWQVVVNGHFLKYGRAQKYSLAASEEILRFCPDPSVDLCDRFPQLCPPREVCRKFPKICQAEIPMTVVVRDGIWAVNPSGPALVDDICAFLPDCPVCDGKAWESCLGWKILLDGLPEQAAVLVFDQDGRIIQEVGPMRGAEHAGQIDLMVSRFFPGQDFYIGFVGPDGSPYRDSFSVGIDLDPLKEIAAEEAN